MIILANSRRSLVAPSPLRFFHSSPLHLHLPSLYSPSFAAPTSRPAPPLLPLQSQHRASLTAQLSNSSSNPQCNQTVAESVNQLHTNKQNQKELLAARLILLSHLHSTQHTCLCMALARAIVARGAAKEEAIAVPGADPDQLELHKLRNEYSTLSPRRTLHVPLCVYELRTKPLADKEWRPLALSLQKNTSSESANAEGRMAAPIYSKAFSYLLIIFMSAIVTYQSCLRSSTIYFFELDTSHVFFMERWHSAAVPLVFSALLLLVYMGTKRSAEIEKQRQMLVEKEKQARSVCNSTINSRKTSRVSSRMQSRRESISLHDDTTRVEKLLAAISEMDVESTRRSSASGGSTAAETTPPENTQQQTVQEDEEQKEGTLQPRSESFHLSGSPRIRSRANSRLDAAMRPRTVSSLQDMAALNALNVVAKEDDELQEEQQPVNIYKHLSQMDLCSYTLSALNLLPSNDPDLPESQFKLNLSVADILAELFAVHLPIWGCVAAFHVVLLELFRIQLAFYFYYHEETMPVSYQAGVILSAGMALFDLFFIYAVDLLSQSAALNLSAFIQSVCSGTVTSESHSPIMITIPSYGENGGKQSLATLDIIVPGMFLNLLLKYSSMYDPSLFIRCYYSVILGLIVTLAIALYRSKITPALVLPAIALVSTSYLSCSDPAQLWKFMIKH
ncbi:hypothetical protein WR25_25963 [Diploscapter pachys]|uniref:Uncharacterized protein n=1 Tax=Diploscapter pachys TaxID=2018661 RepID=A0A2A2KSS8_9BILA|nr:hypothetical protein WR25_25963 [Diploscapter pachys]